jgi:cytoskeleton protein RodZ
MTYANQVGPDGIAPDGSRGCGSRLRKAREAAGLSQEDVATRLKMPLRVVQSLENEDWDRLGAPVFVRGQLRSYSRLVGLATSTTLEASGVAPIEPAKLVSHSHTPRLQRLMEQGTRRLVYIVITAAIVIPVWLATKPHLAGTNPASVRPLDVPAIDADPLSAATPADVAPAQEPVVASLAPMTHRPSPVPALALRFTADSWVQVVGRNGNVLEQGLLPAGETRSYTAGEVARVVLGNAPAVKVRNAGEVVDLAPFTRANVARFTVSSDGSVTAAAD